MTPYTKPRDKFVAMLRPLVKKHRFSSDNTLMFYKGLCESFAWLATGGDNLQAYESVLEGLMTDVFDFEYCPECKGKCRGGFAAVKLERKRNESSDE